MTKTGPYQPTDAAARALAKELLTKAAFAALAVLRPDGLTPSISRIALATDDAGCPVSLISTLADHTQALQTNPSCALLIGEPADKGEPLTHPRLTLHAIARLVEKETREHSVLRARYLSLRPKAKLYADFSDFGFVHFDVQDGVLNGGFGKAYRLTPDDL
ncbi:HugZ family protein [Ruegeria sp. EL01]|jgi:hypothetical protein|uniref:HugZ family pyridoxamine 5'-phosphate oxidase n=1 Tax=Ruegeria sp. EL01 TaxID=2107578 RepID=UPI000EA82C3B|nr:pyridoxamine 5'-phosphate oxidase family protein [Ruegeria sp. EL01]